MRVHQNVSMELPQKPDFLCSGADILLILLSFHIKESQPHVSESDVRLQFCIIAELWVDITSGEMKKKKNTKSADSQILCGNNKFHLPLSLCRFCSLSVPHLFYMQDSSL